MKKLALAALVAATTLTGISGANAEPSVARGDYLVNSIMGCGNCHTPAGPNGPMADKALSGQMVDKSAAFTAIAANITPGGEVAKWTDAQLAKAIREGIRPDGSLIGPPMPFEVYKHISDDDLASIVAYLRTVPAVENDPGKSEYHIPLPPAYGPPIEHVASVPEGKTAEYGAYLAAIGHCLVCHSPMDDKGMTLMDTKAGAGGMQFPGPWGISVSANITPTGIGHYSDAELKQVLLTGTRPDGTHLLPPMPSAFLANLTSDDADALIAYLRTLAPQETPKL